MPRGKKFAAEQIIEKLREAVPEPSTCASLLAGLACGGYLVGQRKRTSSGKDCS